MMATKRTSSTKKQVGRDNPGGLGRIVESISPNLRGSPELSVIFGIVALVLAVVSIIGAIRAIDFGFEIFLLALFALAIAAIIVTPRRARQSLQMAYNSAGADVGPEVLERFNREIRPLLLKIRETCHGHCSEIEIQELVRTTVQSVARIALNREELPELAFPGVPSFDPALRVHCGLCGGDDVGVTRTGQCPRCKLHVALWNGYYDIASPP